MIIYLGNFFVLKSTNEAIFSKSKSNQQSRLVRLTGGKLLLAGSDKLDTTWVRLSSDGDGGVVMAVVVLMLDNVEMSSASFIRTAVMSIKCCRKFMRFAFKLTFGGSRAVVTLDATLTTSSSNGLVRLLKIVDSVKFDTIGTALLTL
jgi:hypothetical protein